MTTKTTYIANDGEEFETEEECLAYEKAMDPSEGVVMFDSEYEILHGGVPAAMYEAAMYLYIINEKKATAFFNWIGVNTGYNTPSDYHTGDLLYYSDYHDYNKDDYSNLDKDISELIKKKEILIGKIFGTCKIEEQMV